MGPESASKRVRGDNGGGTAAPSHAVATDAARRASRRDASSASSVDIDPQQATAHRAFEGVQVIEGRPSSPAPRPPIVLTADPAARATRSGVTATGARRALASSWASSHARSTLYHRGPSITRLASTVGIVDDDGYSYECPPREEGRQGANDAEDEQDGDEREFVEMAGLPDAALANSFFSGFLDSLQVASSLRIVSKRLMAIGGGNCKVMDLHSMVIRDGDLASVSSAFPQLAHLNLSFCTGISGSLGESLRPCRHTLQTLILRGVGASDAMVAGLRNFQQLTTLDISQSVSRSTTKITAVGLEELMDLRRLKRLNLAWNKNVTDDVVERLCAASPSLQDLDLGLCSQLTNRCLKALSMQRDLRVLSVLACRNIDDEGIKVLARSCPALTDLDLAHLPLLTKHSLNSLRLLRDLDTLQVRCCELISSADVADFKSARRQTSVTEMKARWP